MAPLYLCMNWRSLMWRWEARGGQANALSQLWQVRDSGWWVAAPMGLVLHTPEVQILWLLAVTFTSKPLTQLPCTPLTPSRQEGDAKGAKSSSAPAEVLICPLAGPSWFHLAVLGKGKTWPYIFATRTALIKHGKSTRLYPQTKQIAHRSSQSPWFLLQHIDRILQTVPKSHLLGIGNFQSMGIFFFLPDEYPVAMLSGTCWIVLHGKEETVCC